MECPLHGMSYPWNVLFMKCPNHGMSYPWYVLSMECPIHGMSYPWNFLFMKFPIHEMSNLRNVISTELSIFEMFSNPKKLKKFKLQKVQSVNFHIIKCPLKYLSHYLKKDPSIEFSIFYKYMKCPCSKLSMEYFSMTSLFMKNPCPLFFQRTNYCKELFLNCLTYCQNHQTI